MPSPPTTTSLSVTHTINGSHIFIIKGLPKRVFITSWAGSGRSGRRYVGPLFFRTRMALLPENDADGDFSETERSGGEENGDLSPGRVCPVTIHTGPVFAEKCLRGSETWEIACDNGSFWIWENNFAQNLNVLAGQLSSSPRLHLSALLELNGKRTTSKTYKIAFVRQEDLFFSQLTVRETLSFAAELQLPEISSAEERDEYVNNLLVWSAMQIHVLVMQNKQVAPRSLSLHCTCTNPRNLTQPRSSPWSESLAQTPHEKLARYGDFFDGKTTSMCVRRGVYYDPETGKEDPSKNGVCSNFLCDSKPGDKIQISGPSGKVMLLLEDDPNATHIIIATGTGVALLTEATYVECSWKTYQTTNLAA
ncbi:unnamed protein product [Microthlaspi erraticum]|uniref:FAD-binding FR-type domain-containing protein n=1 Tax=Microthlaspi erraticum TaxID=1685480 RepID=A0A6D2K1K6_9BRAS|nr:unnamed protein product [Microthlaspi erraticum]